MTSNLEKPIIHFPTKHGDFILYTFESNGIHLALVKGEAKENVLVRIHSECLTGDVLGSKRCDCGEQLEVAFRMIEKEDGILIYLRQEGRGIGLAHKLKAYQLQEKGFDTVSANEYLGLPADARDYTIAAMMLKQLGIQSIRLMTNNPKKIEAMEQQGIKTSRIAVEILSNKYNINYLKAKKEKLGHLLSEEYM